MAKKKDPEYADVAISIEKSQLVWLKKNNYNLSSLTRAYLRELISSMDKTKEGIVVPAWIKPASDETIKKRLKKNPKLKHLVD